MLHSLKFELPKTSHPFGSRVGSIFGEESRIRFWWCAFWVGAEIDLSWHFAAAGTKGYQIEWKMEKDQPYKPIIARSAVRITSTGQNPRKIQIDQAKIAIITKHLHST